MNILVKLASGFMNLFTLGGEQFVSWPSFAHLINIDA